jgi:hypothetical protein
MKIARSLLLLFVLLNFISPSKISAQLIIPSDYNSWAMGAKFGMLPFYGDVRMLKYTPDNKYRKTNTGFAFEGIKNLNHIFGVRADVLLAGLSGSSINMNKHFTAGIKEFSVSGIVNLNDLINFYPEREKVINAYIFAGIGMMNFRSKVYSYDENAFLNGYGWDSTGLSKTAGTNEFTFPVGFGIKYKADSKIDIGLEYTLHISNTDKLDAWIVDKSYMDRFGYAAVSITYKLGSKKEYVDWVNPFQDTTNVFATTANQVAENITNNNTSTVKQNTNSSTTKTNKDTSTTKNNQTKTTNQTTTNNQTNVNNQTTANNTQTTVAAEENYFIVSGAYKTKKLAKEAVVKLKAKGYSNARILGESSSGSWRVSLKGYTTMEDAIADISGIKKTYQYAKLFEKKGEKDFSEISSKIISKLLAAQTDTSKTIKTTTNQTAVTNTTKANTTTTNATTSNQNNVTANINTNNTTSNNTTSNNTANTNTTTNNTSNTNVNTATNTTTQNNTNAVNNANTTTTNNNTTTTTTVTVVKKFYIIAASYPTEQLASEAVAVLKAKGFANAEVVGKNDLGTFRICYKGYATREEAMVDLPGIKQSTNPSAWIFEKK